MVMDTTTNFGLPAPAAGTPAADYDTEFATAMTAADVAIKDAVTAGTYLVAASNASAAVIDAADYVCDGTDDHVQIQAAIDAAEADGGGLVELSSGSFSAGPMTIDAGNVTLRGRGAATVVTANTGGHLFSVVGLVAARIANVAIDDMKLVGTSVELTQVTGNGVYVDFVDSFKLRGLTVSGFGGTGDQGGIQIRRSTAGVVTGNECTDCRNGIITGIATSGDIPELANAVVANNICHNNWDDGIHSQHSVRIVYQGNHCFSNGETGIDALGDANDTIVGNITYSNVQHGIQIGNTTTSTGTPDSGHTIQGNTAVGNGSEGIAVDGNTDDCLIVGNTVADNTRDGIRLAASDPRLVTRVLIANNIVHGNGGIGIYLVNLITNCLVVGNHVNNNTGDGISIKDAAAGTPSGNFVVQNMVSGAVTYDLGAGTGTVVDVGLGTSSIIAAAGDHTHA